MNVLRAMVHDFRDGLREFWRDAADAARDMASDFAAPFKGWRK